MNHRSSVIAALAVLTACTSTVDVPPEIPFAFLDVSTVNSASATGYSAKAQGIFTRARISGVLGSDNIPESCSFPAPIVNASAVVNNPEDPGTVTMTLHGPVDTTTRTVTLRRRIITNTGEEGWVNDILPPIVPGSDSVTYKATGVAGAFPPFTIRAATVATFVPQPVDDSSTGTGIRIRWTASPNTATAMQIALQYADSNSENGAPNRQILCVARDDGDFSINRTYVDEWQQAGEDDAFVQRQVVFSRFLTTTATINDAIVTVVTRRDTTLVK